LVTSFPKEVPKLVGMAQFQLFQVQPLDPDKQRNRLAFTSKDNALAPGLSNAILQGRLVNVDDFHRIPSVV
jgi:hypothetical protein